MGGTLIRRLALIAQIAGLGMAVLLGGSPAGAAPCPAPDHLTRESGDGECLLIHTERRDGLPDHPDLYVLLHGNHSDGSPATSMFRVAAALAARARLPAVAVAVVRPGYNDADGNRSTGNEFGRADNFTIENVDIVAGVIANLKAFHHPGRVILLGHSGGAAIAGVILGRYPGLADAALLIGCPCDIPAWRMRRAGPPWRSASPHDYVDTIPAQTRLAVVVGEDDANTVPSLSKTYAALLKKRGIEADLSVVEGMDHLRILRSPLIVETALNLGSP